MDGLERAQIIVEREIINDLPLRPAGAEAVDPDDEQRESEEEDNPERSRQGKHRERALLLPPIAHQASPYRLPVDPPTASRRRSRLRRSSTAAPPPPPPWGGDGAAQLQSDKFFTPSFV